MILHYIYLTKFTKLAHGLQYAQIFPYYVLNLDFYKFSKNCKKARFVNEHFYNSTMYIILRNRFLPGLFILYLIKNAEAKIKQRVNITQTYLKVQGHNINFKDFL